jgi:hypothetical protein
MSMQNAEGIWPPTYDAEDLAKQISSLVKDQKIFNAFYQEIALEVDLCQGDIISLSSVMPVIDENGDLAILDNYDYWILLGNTCDLARDVADCRYTHICPLAAIEDDIPYDVLTSLRNYRMSRRIYVPDWDGRNERGYTLDLTLVTSIDKECLLSNANRVARMGMYAWLLLHSCLVRFLARDDRRFD